VVYSRQQYCIVQRAECRPRRAVLDGLRWRSPDAADSWIDRAPSPRRLRSMRRRRSIHHDRPPLTPDASISTTPKPMQINPNLTSNILLLLLLLRSYVPSIHSLANHRISLSSVSPHSPHHVTITFRISPACSPPASPASLSLYRSIYWRVVRLQCMGAA
jgi:hypothetical protein